MRSFTWNGLLLHINVFFVNFVNGMNFSSLFLWLKDYKQTKKRYVHLTPKSSIAYCRKYNVVMSKYVSESNATSESPSVSEISLLTLQSIWDCLSLAFGRKWLTLLNMVGEQTESSSEQISYQVYTTY